MIYSWQQSAWQQITQHWQNMHHAWLFFGKENTGKTTFARHFAQALLCENITLQHESCGHCASCHLFSQQTHPDFYELTLPDVETDANARKLLQIKIDAVRSVLDSLTQTSVRSGKRIVLIHPAESMNIQAANALLKMLEEPPEAVVFLLVSHYRDRLLPTIKSRCRQFFLPAPSLPDALAYLNDKNIVNAEELLAFHSGAPLFEYQPEQDELRYQLLDLLSEPRLLGILDYAAEFDRQKWPLAILLDWLHKWIIDIFLVKYQMMPIYYPKRYPDIQNIASKINPMKLFSFSGSINDLKPYGYHSLNVKMQIEDLLSEYLTQIHWKAKHSE